jgi:SHAQKYF class myb-like DNA-binding protein
MSNITLKIEANAADEAPTVEEQQLAFEGSGTTVDMKSTQTEPTNTDGGLLELPSDVPQADDALSSVTPKVPQPSQADGPVLGKRVSTGHTIVVPQVVASKSSKSKKKKPQPVVAMASTPTSQSGSQGAQGENTGRWTAEEHRLFLQGLEQHGKGWKKIASLIKSRTVVQIRTHAQKYFQKLAKARQNGEEGDVSMEGRVGVTSVTAVAAAVAQKDKRRRQTTGTKRKAIQSVVGSVIRQGKKIYSSNRTGTRSLYDQWVMFSAGW